MIPRSTLYPANASFSHLHRTRQLEPHEERKKNTGENYQYVLHVNGQIYTQSSPYRISPEFPASSPTSPIATTEYSLHHLNWTDINIWNVNERRKKSENCFHWTSVTFSQHLEGLETMRRLSFNVKGKEKTLVSMHFQLILIWTHIYVLRTTLFAIACYVTTSSISW